MLPSPASCWPIDIIQGYPLAVPRVSEFSAAFCCLDSWQRPATFTGWMLGFSEEVSLSHHQTSRNSQARESSSRALLPRHAFDLYRFGKAPLQVGTKAVGMAGSGEVIPVRLGRLSCIRNFSFDRHCLGSIVVRFLSTLVGNNQVYQVISLSFACTKRSITSSQVSDADS